MNDSSIPTKPETNEIAVKPDPFSLMDQLDDEAILAELEGRVVGSWVYEFMQDGKQIRGLSKVGVDAACREMRSEERRVGKECRL